jgi:hypothetical protein
MISHNILPKEQSVKNCSECHSANSLLQASLYRYENIQARKTEGVFASILQEQPYIIGANQVPVFKYLSISMLIITLLGIFIHALMRMFLIKKK